MKSTDIRKYIEQEDALIHLVDSIGIQSGRENVKFSGKSKKIASHTHSVIVDKKQIAF